MCDIWKESTRAEISSEELQRHLADIHQLSVEWVVLSGGEPLMHSDLFRLCALLRERKIRITLLSTGLLLERHAESIVRFIDEVIVSLDGPPKVHDGIRRVKAAFSMLERGIQAMMRLNPAYPIRARCTVQHANHSCLREAARTAKKLGLRSISFLAADLTSEAFNRPGGWNIEHQERIALKQHELAALELEMRGLAAEWDGTGFVLESREKLERIVLHFRAHLGLCEPVSPRCAAPWVSAVIEADGTVRPCFFHPPIGKLNGRTLLEVLNGPEALRFREDLNVATDPICRTCVCSLNLQRDVSSQSEPSQRLQRFYKLPTT
jgi:MoaA/NifB/PqqE/SkfB family radical SAM enzyme